MTVRGDPIAAVDCAAARPVRGLSPGLFDVGFAWGQTRDSGLHARQSQSDTHTLDAVSARPWASDVLDYNLQSWRDGLLKKIRHPNIAGCLITGFRRPLSGLLILAV